MVCLWVSSYLSAFFYMFDSAKLSHKVKMVNVNLRSLFEAVKVFLEATICFYVRKF